MYEHSQEEESTNVNEDEGAADSYSEPTCDDYDSDLEFYDCEGMNDSYDPASDSDVISSNPSYDEEDVEYLIPPSDSEEIDEMKSLPSVSTTSSDQYYTYYFSDDDDANACFDDDCPES